MHTAANTCAMARSGSMLWQSFLREGHGTQPHQTLVTHHQESTLLFAPETLLERAAPNVLYSTGLLHKLN